MRIVTPQEWIDIKRGKDVTPAYLWNAPTITRMLMNEQYIGTYIAGKAESKGLGSHNSTLVDKSKWIIIPDSHTPIISKEDFDRVQVLMEQYLKSRTAKLAVGPSVMGESKRPTRRVLMQEGKLTASTPLYGYKNALGGERELSYPAAKIVREVFELALQGKTSHEISEILTAAGHPTPREQINLDKGKEITLGKAWTHSAINSILRNEQYTGTRIAGRILSKFDGTDTMYRPPESEWIKYPNRHPAIVSADEFTMIRAMLSERQSGRRKQVSHNYLLKGKVKCGCCKLALSYDKGVTFPVYRCDHTAADPNAECHKMKVPAKKLDDAVMTSIRKQAEVVLNSESLSDLRKVGAESQKVVECENALKQCVEERHTAYERFVLREIDRETYLSLKTDCTA
jgi:hypothetical protein